MDKQRDCLKLSDTGVAILENRYLLQDETGQVIETPNQMFWRVARNVAAADQLYGSQNDVEVTAEGFYRLLASLQFLPNSPTLMNAGKRLQQLSACFVIPIEDSLPKIFDALKNAALIQQSGGGTGFSFSRLRPKDDLVTTTRGKSSGPLSFMRIFNTTTETIKQGGVRKGANMGILRVDHPDIFDFIQAKEREGELANFNLSVGVTDQFMKSLEEGTTFPLINPRTKQVDREVQAQEIFDAMIDQAWRTGEPGVVFLDRINRGNPTPHLGEIESTNPCGEQPLLPYESCNLGSIDLSKFVVEREGKALIDFSSLGKTVQWAVHFLDNVIDVNRYPLPQIEHTTKGNRKIGLGIMGFADLLILLGIPYDSKECLQLIQQVMGFIWSKAWEASAALAERRGSFSNYPGSRLEWEGKGKIRNATVTTIAPTGTISLIAGCSSGVEPLFALAYIRTALDQQSFHYLNPLLEERTKQLGIYNQQLVEQLIREGSLRNIPGVPDDMKRVFVTAHDVSPEWHVKVQAAFQRFVDNAVSKTVNLPYSATRDEVSHIYRLAYQLGCKGVTVYRDRSRSEQVLHLGGGKEGGDSGCEQCTHLAEPAYGCAFC